MKPFPDFILVPPYVACSPSTCVNKLCTLGIKIRQRNAELYAMKLQLEAQRFKREQAKQTRKLNPPWWMRLLGFKSSLPVARLERK